MSTSTNRKSVGAILETTWGTTPTSPTLFPVRVTGIPDLAKAPVTVVSNEIRSDRQVSDLILVNSSTGGGINFELVYRSQAVFLLSALYATVAEQPVIVNAVEDTQISNVANTGSVFTVASGGGSFLANHLVRTRGFSNSGNNIVGAKVTSSTSTTVVATGETLVDEATVPLGAAIEVIGIEGDSGDISATATGLQTAGAIDWTDFEIAAGDWVKIGGSATGDKFATAACNGWARVSAVSATDLTFDLTPTGWTTDAGSGKTIQVFLGDRYTNGTTERSLSIEITNADQSSTLYEMFAGMIADTLSITMQPSSIVTGAVSFMGKTKTASTTRTSGASTQSYNLANNTPLNSSSNIGQLYKSGSAIGTPNYVLGASVEIANNLRRDEAVGQSNAIGIGAGEFNVTGNLSTYFGDSTFMDIADANTEFGLMFGFKDQQDACMTWDLPSCKLSEAVPDRGAKNQAVPLNARYQAFRNSTLDYTLRVQSFDYVAD